LRRPGIRWFSHGVSWEEWGGSLAWLRISIRAFLKPDA
jgi:hypothetical protein